MGRAEELAAAIEAPSKGKRRQFRRSCGTDHRVVSRNASRFIMPLLDNRNWGMLTHPHAF
jgi:hypothetical protein